MQAMTVTTPPVAAKQSHSFTHHGITVSDDYAWLRDPKYPEVTDKAVLARLEHLEDLVRRPDRLTKWPDEEERPKDQGPGGLVGGFQATT